MVFRKISCAIVCFSLFVALGCKKYEEYENTFVLSVKMSDTGNGVAGVKYKIVETKSKFNAILTDATPTGIVYEGVTDQSGNASVTYKVKKSGKYKGQYHYNPYTDFSSADLLITDYEIFDTAYMVGHTFYLNKIIVP